MLLKTTNRSCLLVLRPTLFPLKRAVIQMCFSTLAQWYQSLWLERFFKKMVTAQVFGIFSQVSVSELKQCNRVSSSFSNKSFKPSWLQKIARKWGLLISFISWVWRAEHFRSSFHFFIFFFLQWSLIIKLNITQLSQLIYDCMVICHGHTAGKKACKKTLAYNFCVVVGWASVKR